MDWNGSVCVCGSSTCQRVAKTLTWMDMEVRGSKALWPPSCTLNHNVKLCSLGWKLALHHFFDLRAVSSYKGLSTENSYSRAKLRSFGHCRPESGLDLHQRASGMKLTPQCLSVELQFRHM